MIGHLATSLLSALGRRASLYGALALAALAAGWKLYRQGRHAAEAEYAVRRADARVKAGQAAREIRDDLRKSTDDDLDRRLRRWMRPPQ
ncbi:hypothetical protein [Roseovarius sp. SYSU LYC5161]|jgi:hypothetical protein|uniref:hypothetical protein n=1 Tax=Roseovarius halophilus (ex Wu et al. 2025) TaxID=3376060 RepID=UPI00399A4350